jgi:hypothetical protein
MFRKFLKIAEIDLIKNTTLAFAVAIAFSLFHFVAISGFFILIFLIFICGVALDMVFALVNKVFGGQNTTGE